MDNTGTGAVIGGPIGFGSDATGYFSFTVPDGTYNLAFGGVIVVRDINVSQDIDLGKVVLNR